MFRRGDLLESTIVKKNNYCHSPTAFSSVPTDLLQYIACVTNRYPDNRLAVTTLRTPDARSAQSNIVIVRFQSYAPTLRCRCVATTRLQPFGKGNDFSPAPHGQGTLLQSGNKGIIVVLTSLYRYGGLQKPYTYAKILHICKTK